MFLTNIFSKYATAAKREMPPHYIRRQIVGRILNMNQRFICALRSPSLAQWQLAWTSCSSIALYSIRTLSPSKLQTYVSCVITYVYIQLFTLPHAIKLLFRALKNPEVKCALTSGRMYMCYIRGTTRIETIYINIQNGFLSSFVTWMLRINLDLLRCKST